MESIKQDRAVLRELAKKQMQYAASERNQDLIQEWYRHNGLVKGRPMVHIELATFEHEFIPQRLKCKTETGRRIEAAMYREFLNFELFEDDHIVPDFFPVYWDTKFKLFDLDIDIEHAANGNGSDLGHHFKEVFTDLNAALPTLKKSTYSVDREGTLAYKQLVEEMIGDIMPVQLNGRCLQAEPTQKLVHLMGMESMFMAMYDAPEAFKKVMDRIAEDYVEYFNWLASEDLLLPTNSYQPLYQGTFCFNRELPDKEGGCTTQDLWGYLDSQETVGVSPDMFGEFIFPAYKKIADTYGLVSYGCCEPVDAIYDNYISQIDGLRKISISPWCDESAMGDRLKDSKTIYLRKPSPNFIGVTKTLDEEAVRAHIRSTVECAKDCQLEFAQRDVYTVHHNPDKVKRYVSIIREACNR